MRFGHGWRFVLLGYPVAVDHSFWFVVALIASRRPLDLVLVWVAVVFVSVLVHELGHATVARRYGLGPRIELYSMGGLTHFGRSRRLPAGRSILLSLAGPLFGFALGGLVLGAQRLLPPDTHYYARVAVGDLVWVNFGWGLINLLPLLPLDGGNVMRRLIELVKKRPDERLALRISIATAGLGVLWALQAERLFTTFIAAYFLYVNVQAYRTLSEPRADAAWR